MKIIVICVLLGICLASKLENDMYNNKPIIGVFAYPSEFYGSYPSDDYNYIAASYIKWSEQSGARTMPISHDMDEIEMKSLFSKINGLLFPGGFWNVFENMDEETQFTPAVEGAKKMLELAIQANYDGDFFPIYGIQSGMQMLMALIGSDGTGKQKLFHRFQTINFATKLQFMRNATNHMWSYQSKDSINFLSSNDASFYYANYSMSVKHFLRNEKLRNMFEITAMSEDESGQKFVAAVEGKNLPIYGTQFFAQGNIFEWKNNLKLDHHPYTVDFSQQLANFFGQHTRKSSHDYKMDDTEDELLIYNFKTDKIPNDWFEQIYFFEKGDLQRRLSRMNARLAQKSDM